ncbi:MAG: hypothetical protein DWH85_01510 [Planctomycetota bacterium]|nr:MAG: hypothetical protein DWH85_01510 [Planctomycetota bacterium]
MMHLSKKIGLSLVGSAALLFGAATFALAGNQFATNNGANANNLNTGAIGNQVDPNGETIQARFGRLFPGGGLHTINGSLRRVWGTTFSHGVSPSASADSFMREWSMLWNVPYTQLEKVGPTEDGAHTLPLVTSEDGTSSEFTVAYFRQQAKGVPVFRSYGWGLVRSEDNFPMVLAGATLRNIGTMEAQLAGKNLDASSIDVGLVGSQALGQFTAPPQMNTPRYVVWAGLDEDVQTAKLAVEFVATGGGAFDPSNYQKILFVVDAANGNILFQESMIHHGTVTGQVNEYVTTDFRADACSAEVIRGMPYAKILIGSTTVYADTNGAFTHTYSGTGSVLAAATLAGKYFKVVEQSSTLGTVPLQTLVDGSNSTFLFNPTPNVVNTAQTNSYEIANRTREKILTANASYPTIATQTSFTINTNIADVCNAYYDGSSINFFSAGSGCNNTAFGDVVAHEYGHHMVQCGGSGQGEYGEGQSDIVGIIITDNSQLGVGFQSCSSGIRSASNSCQYSSTGCSSCGSEIHSCGQLISGCFWSLRSSFITTYPSDYRTRLAKLAVNSTPLHAGSSSIQNDITLDYLTLDDDNGNLGDGSPNYSAISNAFSAHGLLPPALALFTISLPNGGPTTVDPSGGTTMSVSIVPVSSQVLAGSPKLYYREGISGTFSSVALTSNGGTNYTATFPAGGCNTTVQYYIEAKSTGGTALVLPTTAPTTNYSTTSVLSSVVALLETFDGTTTAFTVGAAGDTATAGIWIRSNTASGCGATPAAYSGSKAFLTGSGSCNDVDNGRTTLLSPSFSGIGSDEVYVKFALYMSYNSATPTDDPLEAYLSNDGGVTWVLVGSYSTGQAWNLKTIKVKDFLTVSTDMKVKFVAQDNGTDNVVEAAIDSFSVTKITCFEALFGDLDGSGTRDSGDVALLLVDFGACPGCPGDLDGSGEIDSADTALLFLNFD